MGESKEDKDMSLRAQLIAALKEAISFQNDDTECRDYDGPVEQCLDRRCMDHGCMIARVNRWRAALAKAEAAHVG